MSETTTTPNANTTPVEEIVGEAGSDTTLGIAIQIVELQTAAANLTDNWRDPNKPGRPWDERTIDYYGVPHDFLALCRQVAEYEVRLPSP